MQGFNMGRYIPPDLEGTTSFNAASGKGHSLGARARKLKIEGILTVRFELPFAVWCTHCNPEQIIGQGVRFNAEKKKVGNYYTTVIWSFRFKHTVCGGWIEVRTDPKNAEYVVVEGGRRRDTGADKLLDGEVRVGVSEEEKERLEKDGGFGALEKKVEDKRQLDSEKGRIEELARKSERAWADPYERNRNLRKDFRVGRKAREEQGKRTEELRDKLSLGIDLLSETAEDGARAKLIEFRNKEEGRRDARPIFQSPREAKSTTAAIEKRGKKLSSAELAAQKKAALQERLKGNSRVAVDPFLREEKIWTPKVKRKRTGEGDIATTKLVVSSAALVGYDSESS